MIRIKVCNKTCTCDDVLHPSTRHTILAFPNDSFWSSNDPSSIDGGFSSII